jgi:hypothetical protein
MEIEYTWEEILEMDKRDQFLAEFQTKVYEKLKEFPEFSQKKDFLITLHKNTLRLKYESLSRGKKVSGLEHNKQVETKSNLIGEMIKFVNLKIDVINEILKLDNNLVESNSANKIKWLGSPSLMGFVFVELMRRGFIELPLYNGEENYTALANHLDNFFEYNGKKSTLEKECSPKSNSLSETKRAKFTIPKLLDLK